MIDEMSRQEKIDYAKGFLKEVEDILEAWKLKTEKNKKLRMDIFYAEHYMLRAMLAVGAANGTYGDLGTTSEKLMSMFAEIGDVIRRENLQDPLASRWAK